MRILFVLDIYYPAISGATVAPDRIAKALAAAGHKVGIIAPSEHKHAETDNTNNPIIYYIPSQSIPLIKVAQDMRISPLPFSEVKNAIDAFMPDVIHVHHGLLIGLAAQRYAKELGIPVVGTNHFMPENLIHNLTPRPIKKLEPLATPMSELLWKYIVNFYNNCAYVTSPSMTAINLLQEHGLTTEATAVSNGIDTKLFGNKPKDKKIARKYHVPLTKPIVLYMGRVDGEKRIEDILLAAALVLTKLECTTVIAGKGYYAEHLTNLAEKLNIRSHIVFTGFIADSDLPGMYGLGDIFVMPSPVELQSVATMEAMASGLPIVATHSGALSELVYQGKNGYLYEKGNTFELSEYIVSLLSDKKLCSSAGAWSRKIIHHHDMRKVVADLEKIYSSLSL